MQRIGFLLILHVSAEYLSETEEGQHFLLHIPSIAISFLISFSQIYPPPSNEEHEILEVVFPIMAQ